MEETKIKVNIHLTIDEVNYILNCIQEKPFKEVNALVQNIIKQAQDSLPKSPDEEPVDLVEAV